MEIIKTTVQQKGFLGLYAGCGALVAGNAVKAGVRFLSYDHFKAKLQDENVHTTLICLILGLHRN
jgi:solute carrier family 25 (mitochondrial citrate transporter), member 1